MITKNKGDLIKLFGKEVDFTRKNEIIKITMLDADITKDGKTIKSADTIKDYANNLSKFMCVYLTMYSQVVKADSSKRDYTMGQFYLDLFKSGFIDPYKPAKQQFGTQDILDKMYGEGTYLVYGAGKDTGGGEQFHDLEGNTTSGKSEIFDKLIKYGDENIGEIFTVRFLKQGTTDVKHNMDVYSNQDGVLYQYDTADYGMNKAINETNVVDRNNIISWYYIKKASAQEKMIYRKGKLQNRIEEIKIKNQNHKKSGKKAKGK